MIGPFLLLPCLPYIWLLGLGTFSSSSSPLRGGDGKKWTCEGVWILREEVEGEGEGAREGEVGRLLALREILASFGEAGTESEEHVVKPRSLSASPARVPFPPPNLP